MSYILEALKKAQAERQLGSAPSIHTLPIPTGDQDSAGRDRLPLMLGGGGMLLALAAGILWWRQGVPPAAPVAVVATAPVPAEAPAAPPVIVVPASPPPAQPAYVSPSYVPPIPPAVPAPRPVAAKPAPAAPAMASAPPAVKAPPASPEPATQAAATDNVPSMAQLPESIQSQLPKVTFGGFMYSNNPADRLLLIDKVLRHEGDEVAPGLVLEQLQPRAAVMNYRGTRYRVAY